MPFLYARPFDLVDIDVVDTEASRDVRGLGRVLRRVHRPDAIRALGVLGMFSSEIGSPPAIRRSANDGMLLQVERSRDARIHLHDGSLGVLSRIQA